MAGATRGFGASAEVVLLLILATTAATSSDTGSGSSQDFEVTGWSSHGEKNSFLHNLEKTLGLVPTADR